MNLSSFDELEWGPVMLFYHYCSFEKFQSILSSKTLWLTQIVKSNDQEEVKRTLQIIWSRIRDEVLAGIADMSKSKELIGIIDSQLNLDTYCSTIGGETPYGVCLTVNRDLSQNWNEYAESGKGICLGFSEELFEGIDRKMPHPNANFESAIGWEYVIYDRENIAKQFAPLFISILKHDQTAIGWLTVRTTLKHYSAFIKNPTFIDEREVRIIYYPSKEHNLNNSTEMTSHIESNLSHCALPWIKNNGLCALKEIIVGNNCEHSKESINSMLKKDGIRGVKIIPSEYPYRISQNR